MLAGCPPKGPSYGTTKPCCQLIDLDISEERGPIPCRHWWFKGLGSSCSHLTELGKFGTFHFPRLFFFWWFSHQMILTENFPFKQASNFQLDIISRKFPVAVMNTKVVAYHLNSSWFPTGGTLGRHCWHEKHADFWRFKTLAGLVGVDIFFTISGFASWMKFIAAGDFFSIIHDQHVVCWACPIRWET